MLIIPIEQKLDSSNPPIITVLLIVINFFVFFAYQQPNDDTARAQYTEHYFQTGLYAYEQDIYLEYLILNDLDKYDAFQLAEEEQKPFWVMHDPAFSYYLRNEYFIKNYHDEDWRLAREEFDEIIDSLSARRFGLIPAELNVVDLITSVFLHAGIVHLIGNMIFLFIYGFSLEVALGRLWFLSIYLLSGIGGDLLTWAMSSNSYTPTIGASGAIFGLLGMYLGLYGFKKIKFFFTVGFYANQFMAPALILLPYWALIELHGQLTGQDYVAHYAHLGGLLTGVLIVAAGKDRFIKINRDYVEKVDDDAPFREKYEIFLRQLDDLNIDHAKQLIAELLRMKPSNLRLMKHKFDLYKLKPADPEFEKIALAVFSQTSILDTEASMIAAAVNEYDRISHAHNAFKVNTCTNLFNLFLRTNHLEEAEQQLQKLQDQSAAKSRIPGLLLRMITYFNSHNQKGKAERYVAQLFEQYPDSEAADHIRAIRND